MMHSFPHTLQLAGLLSSRYLTDSQDSSIVSPAQHKEQQQKRRCPLGLFAGSLVVFFCRAVKAWTAKEHSVEFLLWECQQWLLWCWWRQLLQKEAAYTTCNFVKGTYYIDNGVLCLELSEIFLNAWLSRHISVTMHFHHKRSQYTLIWCCSRVHLTLS